ELLRAARRRAGRICADRGRAQVPLAEVGVFRTRILIAPRVAAGAIGRGVVSGGLLPFGLGGQPSASPVRVGLRLVEAHVHNWFVGRDRLDDAETGAQPAVAVTLPE